MYPQRTLNALPFEIINAVLLETVKLQEQDSVVFTFGLSHLPECRDKTVSTRPQKYVKGPTPPYQLRWDAAANLRLVCRDWHEWALEYALADVYVKVWRGSERWCDLTHNRGENSTPRSQTDHKLMMNRQIPTIRND